MNENLSRSAYVAESCKPTIFLSHYDGGPELGFEGSSQSLFRALNSTRTVRYFDAKGTHLAQVEWPLAGLGFESRAFGELTTWLTFNSLLEALGRKSEQSMVGFFHYRRLLDPAVTSKKIEVVRPSFASPLILRRLEREYLRIPAGHSLVAKSFPVITMDVHYHACHPESYETFLLAKEIFLALLGRSGADHFGHQSNLFWSTLFFGPQLHANEFSRLLLETFSALARIGNSFPATQDSYQSRWPGFIAERLFSIFVSHLIDSGQPFSEATVLRFKFKNK